MYTVRVNPLQGSSVSGLLAQLQAEGVEARASSVLPEDFIEVVSGLQTLLAKVRTQVGTPGVAVCL